MLLVIAVVFCVLEGWSLILIYFLNIHLLLRFGRFLEGNVVALLMDVIHWGVQHCKSKSVKSSFLKLGLAASIYYVWKERNVMTFQ